MAKVNFTAARVEAHRCAEGKSQSFLWDSKTPGLGLRATSGGAKAYIFQGKIHGSTVRMTIGDPRSWTIDVAQERARSLQTLIDGGIDPREQEAEQKAAHEARRAAKHRQDVTVGEAWEQYLEHLRTKISPKTKKPRSERYILDHINLSSPGGGIAKRGGKEKVRGPLAPLIPLKLTDITATSMSQWLEGEIPRGPTNAGHAFGLFKAFIRWCDTHEMYAGIILHEAYSSPKVKGILPRSAAKDDCLQREQLSVWFSAVRSIANPVISAYLQGLLITGARREELAALRWEDVDFRWRSLTMNDKVEGTGGRTIPLTPYLSGLLLHLQRLNEIPPNKRQTNRLAERREQWEPSEWVFASKTASDGKIAEPRHAHNRALEPTGLPHISLHGLRRSFGTLSEWVEVPVGVVAQIQGHKPSAIAEKHYRRRPLDLLRMWHDKIEAWMLEQAQISFEPKS
ncbi:tyrosine-type recombinase/integrase [Paraburkholderia sp. D15]|uniref:tyrosine-type recombinase/integrase n=1 Tax=Paraburkholderia sp. D15 TaxID=2880218 RepID=UPI00247A5857|nr:tyrosine-type recombinase/integrase [Paraburkholderia sp. D15]WGS50155.1 tyrosine-type recombinase/integrase [Paraburkholderia sp. D15]